MSVESLPLSEREPEVVVVGLGPVGVTLCSLLAAAGIRTEGVDAQTDVYALPRAIGMDHEVMRIFQGIGAADGLGTSVAPYRPSEYRSASGALLRRFDSQPEPHPLAWPPYLTFVQPDLERALRKASTRHSALTLRHGTSLVELSDPAAPRLVLKDAATGETFERRPRFVIGCDGGPSFVRRSLGIGFEDLDFDEPWLVVDMLIDDPEARLPETNVQFCNPERPHTYVVGPGNLRRWEFMLLPGEQPSDIDRPERIAELLSLWLRPGQARLWRSATYNFHALVAERWRQDAVFLAGDACHMTPPFLAQGMVQGIKDASNLAWKIVQVIRGAPDSLLDSYQAERRPFVRDVISVTKDLGRVICELDPAKARKRDAELEAAIAGGQGTLIRQNLFPPIREGVLARLPDGALSPGAGEPGPQPWISTPDGRRRLDDIVGSDFRLLASADMPVDGELLSAARELGLTVHRVGNAEDGSSGELVEESGVLADWLAARDAQAVLLRPDHIVFGTARPGEVQGLVDQLRGFLT